MGQGKDIVVIGAGNVATHLSQALHGAGHRILQVYSRTRESAQLLASRLGCPYATSLDAVRGDAQVYILCVKDSVLEEVARGLQGRIGDALVLHTAGSMPMEVLPYPRRGVLYPMQTFSRDRQVDFAEIPLFIESATDEPLLRELAQSISRHVYAMGSEQRKHLHVAAVLACNFVNHMYALSSDVLQEAGIPFEVMLPLIDETARKVHNLSPLQAQTGPAVRFDQNVMQAHEAMLPTDVREIYRLLSQSIHRKAQNE